MINMMYPRKENIQNMPSLRLARLTLFTIILSMFSAGPVFSKCSKPVLVHGWGGSWVPFVMGTAEQPSGLEMEILDAVFKRANCHWKNTPHVIPWARHLKQVEAGEVDLATSASWTKERADYAYFSLPYRTEYAALYVLKEKYDAFSKLNLKELAQLGFKLGAIRGEVYGEVIGKFVSDLGSNVSLVQDNDQNMQKLILGRIDGYVGHIPHDNLLVNEKGAENQVVVLPKTVQKTGEVHIMMSKKSTSQSDLEAINEAINSLKSDGTLDAIKGKYSKMFNIELY